LLELGVAQPAARTVSPEEAGCACFAVKAVNIGRSRAT
jgi:hypothetical protein